MNECAVRSATQPLAGIRIVEISSFVAAPLAGMTLAQLGAEVIRVDPIGGAADYRRWPLAEGGASIYWTGLNKGKRSVTCFPARSSRCCCPSVRAGPESGFDRLRSVRSESGGGQSQFSALARIPKKGNETLLVAVASDRALRARERGEAGQDTVDPDLVAT